MKTIAIVDMPKCCRECSLFLELKNGYGDVVNMKCCLDGFGIESYDFDEERGKKCPLRPMPEKLDFWTAPSGFYDETIDGWNWCIEEITGETE